MHRFPKPNWKHWNSCDLFTAREAVALSLDMEPSELSLEIDLVRTGITKSQWQALASEFASRLDIVRRAWELQPSRFTAPNDVYSGLKPLEKRHVLPSVILQFFREKNFAVPREWIEPDTDAATTTNDANSGKWHTRALELGKEILRGKPRWSLDQVAQEVEGRLAAEGVTGRGARRIKAATILRHALKGLNRP
jgi:hypothetical protein